jgi:16S rRNA (uracil1498-N3)-methyltransferase
VTLRRLHLPPERIEGARGLLGPEARRYLETVLRLGPGARLEVFDGRGGRYEAAIEEGFEAVRLGAREEARPAAAEIALVVALAKGEKMDLVVQKCTELGVARVLPFAAERSVVRLDAARSDARVVRWRRIAEEAARQCGRADVPEVRAPASLGGAIADLAPATRAFVLVAGGAPLGAWPPAAGDEPPPYTAGREAVRRERVPGAAGVPLAAIVGPEGGLTEAEVRACEAAGASAASLGPRTLRAETAAIVAVALLQARFGDLA